MLGLVARLLGGAITPLIDQISASSARLLRKLALFCVAGVSLVVVLIALTIAFDLWIASMAGAIVGALAVAGLYLGIAIIAILLALRKPRPQRRDEHRQETANEDRAAEAATSGLNSQIDSFIAPLLNILQGLGLRREQLAVLAGMSVAKQIGPLPLVGLAILAGFLIGRMWGGWRAIFSSDLVATLLSTDVLAALFGGRRDPTEAPGDPETSDRA